jgi:putative ABC transport system permease protein
VRPALGRIFDGKDFENGNERVIILSDALWQRRFGADPGVIGRTTIVNGKPYTVVGVMPKGFEYPSSRYHVWVPFPLRPSPDNPPINRGSHYLQVVARLAPGVSIARAQGEMEAVTASLAKEYPATNDQLTARVVSVNDTTFGAVRPALMALLGAVGFVVLIACGNVTSLLLARATGRAREVAIRAALGAGAPRLVRQFLVESLLLYAVSGIVAVIVASWGLSAFIALSPGDIPRLDQTTLDGRVLGFTAAVSLLTGLVFGLAPAWQATRLRLSSTLNAAGRSGSGTRSGHRLRAALVVGEIALSVVLVVGAGLAARSFIRLANVDTGFDVDEELTFGVVAPATRYPDAQRIIVFYRQLLEALGSAPGVRAVGVTTHLPLSGQNLENGFSVEGRDTQGEQIVAGMRGISPEYFTAMGIPIRRGRAFTLADREGSEPVAIVTELFARRYFGGRDPLTMRVSENGFDGWRKVVGVIGDVKHSGPREETRPEVYMPYDQLEPGFMATWARGLSVILRGGPTPSALASGARERVHALDATIPLTNVQTIASLASDSVAEPRFRTVLLGLFAGVALMLAMVGVFGVMSYFVTQRLQEIGIRIALGAARSDVIALIVGRGVTLAAAGIALGVLGAVPLMQWRRELLFEVRPTDPLTFVAAAGMVGLVAIVASYLPARRAARLDPVLALRSE